TIVSTGASTANFTAPATPPSPNTVNVIATPAADPARAASVTLTITVTTTIAVQVSPATSTRAVNHRQTLSVEVTGTSNRNVTWQVNGTPGGDTTAGQICVVGVGPCQPVSTTNGGSVDYLAPASVPSRNPVTVSATSQADSTKSGSAQVTILAHLQVNVSPPSVTLAPRATQQFTAAVDGTSDQVVTWQVSGPGCGGAGSPCGGIDSTGFYTAPFAPPAPNTVNVTATSSEDTSRSGSARVTIATGLTITALLPASVTASAAGGFTLKVEGANFVASSPGPGSTILFNNSPRTTNCSGSSECTTTLAGVDVATAASLPVQIRNTDNTTSNQVFLVVVPPAASDDVIALSSAAPSATGKDIVVVEPTTAGTSTDLNLNVVAVGSYSASSNTCVLGSDPLVLARPASGTATADICAFSLSGLDPALNYTLTGPAPNDILVVAKQPLGLGIIRLTLQLSSTALPGPRTLFIENANKDKTAATGAFEVK
ncbi:MAG: hypothetical protein HY237_08170, partial [Acidobacteria bacterium]|nr:hypothetical protein [Acidobacteriota bacterium]